MIEENSGFVIEREIHVKKVKRILDNWREVVLLVNSILLWKRNFYPWLVAVLTTYFFIELAHYSPSFLTSIGIIALFATLIDFGGPSLSAMAWRHEDWTATKEREFEEVCRSLAVAVVYVKQIWAYIMDLKQTKPIMYFAVTISVSVSLAVIGNAVNNIFILYVICMSLLMLPGMLHYGILQKYYKIGLSYFVMAMRSVSSSGHKDKTQ